MRLSVRPKGLERLAILIVFRVLFGAQHSAWPKGHSFFHGHGAFCLIALGYDSIVAVTVTYVASQVGNAASWMSPFSVAVAQGIAGSSVLSGATSFNHVVCLITAFVCRLLKPVYGNAFAKNPLKSAVYDSGLNTSGLISKTAEEQKPFLLGHRINLSGNVGCF